MTLLTDVQPAAAEPEAVTNDRRRPGRLETVSSELIPILRGQTSDVILEFEDFDETAPLRGLFFGILFSVPLWVGIAYLASSYMS